MKRPPLFTLRFGSLALTVVAGLAMSANARAAAVAITNFSFETPAQGDGTTIFNPAGYGYARSSTNNDYSGYENPPAGSYTGAGGNGTPSGADGSQVGFINIFNTGDTGALFQDVGTLQANTTYTFTVAIGQRLDRVNQAITFSLINTAAGSGTTSNTGTSLSSGSGVSTVAGSFQDFSTTYTTGATVTGDLTIQLSSVGNSDTTGGQGNIQGSFDNLRLDAVPEPTSLALIAVGGLGVLVLRRRRAVKQA